MNPMLKVQLRSMLVTSLRDKITLFYSLLLPIVLMFGLAIYIDKPEQQLRIICGITAISTVFWGMQGIAFQVHWQRSRGVYKLLKLTPMPLMQFIAVMIVARTVIGVAMNWSIWLIGMLSFGMKLTAWSIGLTLLVIVIGTICFTSIGFVIANAARNEAQINMLSNLLQMPMIFMSSAFYSLNGAPDWVAFVGRLLPFEHYTNLISTMQSAGSSISILSLIVLVIYIMIAILIASITFRWDTNQVILKSSTA